MAVTSKGTRWERLHSLWIILPLTLFFNWIGFFYIGIRARQRKWILWGLVYSIPFIIAMLFIHSSFYQGSWLESVDTALVFGLGVASIIHAFMVRKEYLLRLEAREQRTPERDEALRRRIYAEQGTGVQQAAPNRTANQQSPEDVSGSRRTDVSTSSSSQEQQIIPSEHQNHTASSEPLSININNASEQQIANLPGIGSILAKRAINMRKTRGGFQSVEDFGEVLNLKPHVVERIRPLVVIGSLQQSQPSDSTGRIVDF